MKTFRTGAVVIAAGLIMAAGVAAQERARELASERAQERSMAREAAQARYQLHVMEAVLESAVQHGAQVVTAQIRQFSPDLMAFSGPARARGFRLEGYGLFFSVDVPSVRRSVTWTMRTLNQNGGEVARAMQQLRRAVQLQTQNDARARSELEHALRVVEVQVGPVARPPSPASPAAAGAARSGAPVIAASAPQRPASEVERADDTAAAADPPPALIDPDAAYEAEVKRALIDAMLDHSAGLNVGPDEWLTVAARDNGDEMLGADLTDMVTVVLRIRGRDLQAFQAGRASREETRQRVDVKAL